MRTPLSIIISAFLISSNFCSEAKKAMVVPLSLNELVNQVVLRNARAIYQNLQFQISSHQVDFERGIFDPTFYVNLKSQKNNTPNNAQEAATRQFESDYSDQTQSLEMGVNWLSRVGTQWRIDFAYDKHGSTVVDRFRNEPYEYTSGLEVNFRHPLARSQGRFSTQIKVSLAKKEKAIAFDEYRKALMDLISLSISNYWSLYGAQQLSKSWYESLDLAKAQLKDVQDRVKSGMAPKSLALEYQVAISQRKIELDSIQAKISNIHNQIFGLLAVSAAQNQDIVFELLDSPNLEQTRIPEIQSSFEMALENWPEYQIIQNRRQVEMLKKEYARNQILPQFDLVGNVGTTALDVSASRSLGDFASDQYLSHYLGVEYRLPLDRSSAHSNYQIAELRLKQAQLQIDSLIRTLYNGIVDKIGSLRLKKSQMKEYEHALSLRRKLLEVSRERLEYGKISISQLLEEEDKVIDHQRKQMNGVVELKISEASLQKAQGTLLGRFDIKIEEIDSQEELVLDGKVPFQYGDS